ncbi:MAG: hypothetical protein AB8B62_05990 [Roseobacter sp.]
MSDIEELSGRILSAMDRVTNGLNALGQADPAEQETLRQALEEEKQVNAQLTERVRVLGERQEQAVAAMEAKAAEATARVENLDTELQQMRKAHALLSDACTALREANAAGVGEPELINKALEAELDSMRAMRRAEMAEADEIMASLMPLLNASVQAQPAAEAQ